MQLDGVAVWTHHHRVADQNGEMLAHVGSERYLHQVYLARPEVVRAREWGFSRW